MWLGLYQNDRLESATYKKCNLMSFKYPSLVAAVLVDQAILPMFHIGGIPFKLSYLILAVWPVIASKTTGNNYYCYRISQKQRFLKLSAPIIGIMGIGLIGQIFLWTLGDIQDQYLAFRAVMTYVLMLLALRFGQAVADFRSHWLIWILYMNLAINFMFLFAAQQFHVITRIYHSYEEAVGISMALAPYRPTGIFSNPNATMLITNMLLLFIIVSARFGYLDCRAKMHLVLTTIGSLILAFLLASRNQMIVSLVLLAVAVSTFRKSHLIKIVIIVTILIGLAIAVESFTNIRNQYSFIDSSFRRFYSFNPFDINASRSNNILRPMHAFEKFKDRLLVSPIIGSGFSTIEHYPLDTEPGFHNDWFRVLVTSGILGGLLLLLLIYRIHKGLGFLVLIPFVLPGMTNTFLRNIPAVIIYFLMLGVLIEWRSKKAMYSRRKVNASQSKNLSREKLPNGTS